MTMSLRILKWRVGKLEEAAEMDLMSDESLLNSSVDNLIWCISTDDDR